MRVVVTGATGYLGGRLCAALADAGHAVRALVRRSSDVSGLPPGVELAYGDVTNADSLAAAFDGCEAVFHVAAAVEPWLPDPSVFLKVNVGGLENVLKAAKRTPTVKKIVYTSSFFAIGPTDGYVADETQIQLVLILPLNLPQSQNHPEKMALCFVVQCLESSAKVLPQLVKAQKRNKHVEMHQGKAFCTEYEKSKVLADRIALQGATEGVPITIVYPGVIYGPGKLTAGNLVSRITVRVLKHQWAYSCDKAKTELGYSPRNLTEGLSEMLLWLKNDKLIKF
ncbi:uncharacterized protein LOC133911758 isoform X3 [Phragmites australis]|uniref:uncharacterized protein LOC133911758 isoform X3 n=1 Tax=Phragmites australis TaxID=29695 RepID=UPI002D791AF0|nr:uncharacterized protein LOC133911758 isoform X3 [Phragmites australis]